MIVKRFPQQDAFQDYLTQDSRILEHLRFEAGIVENHKEEAQFSLEGYCKLCEQSSLFFVDSLASWRKTEEGIPIPNWRERLVCTQCGLNNRQRAIFHFIKESVERRVLEGNKLSLYATEQVTGLFRCLEKGLANVHCVGSEYVGDDVVGGSIVDTIEPNMRHENIEALSFPSDSFDFVTSNDVLEHINTPERALAQIHRVLKPGGKCFITVPFSIQAPHSVRRAEKNGRGINNLLPPVYHINPISDEGSLVFHNFGWDWLDLLKSAGFIDVSMNCYWSYFYGYLGEPQYYFSCRKSRWPKIQLMVKGVRRMRR